MSPTFVVGVLQRAVMTFQSDVGFFVGIYGHLSVHGSHEFGQVGKAAAVDDKTVERIAYAHAARLGIVDNGFSLFQITGRMEIAVAYACTRFDDRHARIFANKLNQAAASARYHQVDIAYGLKHFACQLVVGRQKGSTGFVETFLTQYGMNDFHNGPIGAVGIRTAFKHTGVAAFQTEREYVERYVGACFVNDADNTERHAHLVDFHTVRLRPFLQRFALG